MRVWFVIHQWENEETTTESSLFILCLLGITEPLLLLYLSAIKFFYYIAKKSISDRDQSIGKKNEKQQNNFNHEADAMTLSEWLIFWFECCSTGVQFFYDLSQSLFKSSPAVLYVPLWNMLSFCTKNLNIGEIL